jgi:tetratricopeptide (TPR) repeat protein
VLQSVRLALGIGLATALALLVSPVLGVHGVESALVLGVVLPPFVAAAAVRQVAWIRRHGLAPSAAAILGRALGMAAGVLALPLLVLALNALRVRNCAPGQGLLYMLLGPLPGVLLASGVGVVFGTLLRRTAVATTLAVAAPLVGVGAALWRFYSTPAIALYGHFFGWFPGAIYDQALSVPLELATFRGITILLIGGLAMMVVALWRPGLRRWSASAARLGPLAAGVGLLGTALVGMAFGPDLGHRVTVPHIVEELGVTEVGSRCIVHAPRELSRSELHRHVADCDFRVHQAERALGVRQGQPVTAFLFRSPDEKRRLMGAANTNIAKPWRHEVYLHLRPWPHPVLEHEVAHVVAGQTGSGPFRVSGRLGGLLPNPGLIEGVAVALAWDPRDELTPHQWARAMVEVERMPALGQVLGLAFMLEPGANAYTATGSFVRYLLDEHGAGVVREAYRTGDVVGATGRPLSDLEARWRAFLATVPLPEGAVELARLRFEQRGLFSTVCPRQLALLRKRMHEDLAAGDAQRLLETCEEILTIDPAEYRARAELVGALARAGRGDEAQIQLDLLASRYQAPSPVMATAHERLGDAAWGDGQVDQARRRYRALLDHPQSPDRARTLEVKALAVDGLPEQRALIRELLLGDEGGGSPPAVVVHLARELSDLRFDGLGPYLEGRQLHQHQRHDRAAALLDAAVVRGLPTERLRREALRLLGTSLYGAGRLADAERFWRLQLGFADGHAARYEAEEWLARIRHARSQR